MTAIDKLYEKIKTHGHVCVGLDTCIDYVPKSERSKGNDAEAVLSFNKALIDATIEVAACFKVQIAYYEEKGIEGLKAYSETLKYIRQKGGIAIADIKRGDIADTAIRYANGHFSGDFEADLVTLNPYMGIDAITPWLTKAKLNGKGAFVLMRTSNPGMRDFEYLETTNGKKVYHIVGDKLSALANETKGNCGYGMFGAVVGCTEREEAAEIRAAYPDLFFLIPGYGAQGGAAEDAALLLRDGNGGVVNASRSIITAWQKEPNNADANNNFAAECALRATVKMRDEIRAVL
ncbi:MAG: orotidine-5'-phosphate decarboxylase [Treponema sp.]|jgi:orotidine-5'-phosphate decarboxylase|nr:orotidine-5'-phosphate decarboxylase [Treponema sp.]